MNVVAYCRVSTDKQDQLNSLETQKKFFTEYTKRNNYNLINIYADEGISGTKIKKREAFQSLMNDAKNGSFSIVIVKDISRFARNTVDFLQSIRMLKSLGIETIFLTSNQTVLGNSEFILTIFGALAQEESANTSKRVKFGKNLNAKKGRVPNLVYGYDKIKGDYFNLKINEKEAQILKKIFHFYVNEGYGTNKIAQILNQDGLKTKKGCNWSQNAICRILTNQIYVGKIINGKEEIEDFLTGTRKKNSPEEWHIIQKSELKIIKNSTFEKAQAILKKRHQDFKLNRHRENNKHIFSTLIKCECCGYSFRRFERTYKNTYVKWVCSGRNSKGSLSCQNLIKIEEKELLQAIKNQFKIILNSKNKILEIILKEYNKTYLKETNATKKKELENDLKKIENVRTKYMEMYTDDLISRIELNKKMQELNKKTINLSTQVNFINNYTKDEEKINEKFDDLEKILNISNLNNSQLKEVIEKIIVSQNGNINVYLK